jgi:type I restriction enzyme S subunit
MKEGWEYCQLEDAVKKGSSNISLNKIKGEDGEYPVFAAKGFVQNVSFYHQEEDYLAIIKDGAGIGRVSKHPAKSSVVGTMQYLIPKEGFDIDFIKYFLEGIDFEKHRNGSTIPHIYFKDYKSEKFPKIPLPEQQRIVSILEKAFAAIDKAKANAEQNLQNAKELFESYLQGVFEKKGDGWEEKIIKEVCELKSGTTISTNLERTEGDVLYVKVGDMTLPENEVEINTSSRFVNSSEIKANQIIPNSAIIFPKRGGAIATNKKRKIVKATIVDLNMMAIIPSSKIDADYFFHWFQLIDLNTISNGTSIPQINNYSFDEVRIPFPKSLKEQQTIVRQLDALLAETQKLETVYQKKIGDLEELKKSILQKAFAGELRSPEGVIYDSEAATPLANKDGHHPSEKKTKNKVSPERA